MTMPAFSGWQPYPQLMVTRQPADVHDVDPDVYPYMPLAGPMVKRFETRSWPCPPKYIGQRVAFHAAKRAMPKPVDGADTMIGEFHKEDGRTLSHPTLGVIDLPLGCIVGSGTVTASLPIVDAVTECGVTFDDALPHVDVRHEPTTILPALMAYPGSVEREHGDDISDQLPYGDWTPGRYAWLIEDAAPRSERCPWCWNAEEWFKAIGGHAACPVCKDVGHCDPIPATGHQGFWNWTP